jgi:hypothetical protein
MISVRSLGLLLTSIALVATLSGGITAQRPDGHAAVLQVCSEDQVAAATTDARHVRGAVVGVTALGTWGTVACSLRERLTFAVKPAADRRSVHGLIRSIKGNPGQKVVSAVPEAAASPPSEASHWLTRPQRRRVSLACSSWRSPARCLAALSAGCSKCWPSKCHRSQA